METKDWQENMDQLPSLSSTSVTWDVTLDNNGNRRNKLATPDSTFEIKHKLQQQKDPSSFIPCCKKAQVDSNILNL